MGKYFQHGDVIIEEIDAIPANIEVTEEPDGILAHGEVTGHMHQCQNPGVSVMLEDETHGYMVVPDEGTDLTHQEHNTQHIPGGHYRIRRVQEYDSFEKQARDVRD